MDDTISALRPRNLASSSLQRVYNEHIKLDQAKQEKYERIFTIIIETVVDTMCKLNPEFGDMYKSIYYGGSYFDGLLVSSKGYEFDLNIVFNLKNIRLITIGEEIGKENFAEIEFYKLVRRSYLSIVNCSLICPECGRRSWSLSPKKMFGLIQRSADAAIQHMGGTFNIDGKKYLLTKKDRTNPYTLIVRGAKPNSNFAFDVDFVPAIQLSFDADCNLLNPGVRAFIKRMDFLKKKFSINAREFMGIALWRCHEHMFQLDFHDAERDILLDKKYIKIAIRLLKLMRDQQPHFKKVWSHLVKTCVMNYVIDNIDRQSDWNHLDLCFAQCYLKLLDGLIRDRIPDVFFRDWNMLTRIRDKNKKDKMKDWLLAQAKTFKINRISIDAIGQVDLSPLFSRCPLDENVLRVNVLRVNELHGEELVGAMKQLTLKSGCSGFIDYSNNESLLQHMKTYHPQYI